MKKLKKLKDNLIAAIKKAHKEHVIKEYFKNNKLFVTYVLTCVINSTLIRFFTINTLENYLSFKAILADLTIIVLLGSFSYFFKPKNRYNYLMFLEIIFTIICTANSVYYTFYTSFASVSMLSLTQYIGQVGDAVVQNVFQLKDLIYLLGPIALFIVNWRLKHKNYYKKIEVKSERKKKALKTLGAGGILLALSLVTMSSLDFGRLVKQWNKEYIVMRFGIYVYQANDIVASLQPKINSMFGYDQAMKSFTDYFKDTSDTATTNEYTNIFKGKNVIVIHGESLQTNAMTQSFNGEEVTPNLNKLASEGMFFSNFYSQVSVGTSSDAELTFNTSWMPTKSGTAFVSYSDRTYIALPQLMKDQGYYTFSMHGNNADFWNRRVMHKNFGYDKFYSKKDYDVTAENIIGLGISDKAFFEQSVTKIENIAAKHDTWYGLLIMLSNHTPFSETDKYGDFPVTMTETVTNADGTTSTVTHPYMEGTKLGNYFKSVHYADSAIGDLVSELDAKGLLDNTVLIIYGDHDARLPKSDYNRLYNYDKTTDSTLSSDDPNYKEYDSYQYELGRKVPFIIWTKDMKGTKLNKKITNVMGMYDVLPTIGNMLGVYDKYTFGHDIFNIKDNNIVVFPTGNWVTNKVYYNSQKGEYLSLTGDAVSEAEIKENNKYADKILDVSNDIIVYNLIKKKEENDKLLSYTSK
jgi:lipoteichoic acid synthase